MPRPAASSRGNPNTQNSAPGSRTNSISRARVSSTSADLDSRIAQPRAGEVHEDVLEGRFARHQLLERALPLHRLQHARERLRDVVDEERESVRARLDLHHAWSAL